MSLWQVLLGVPREGQGGHLVEMSHEEDTNGTTHEEGGHDEEADTVNHASHQDPLFALLPVTLEGNEGCPSAPHAGTSPSRP